MTKKAFLLSVLASFLTTVISAQETPGKTYNKPVGNRDMEESNVPFSKRVHRVIDTRQKKNKVVNWPKSRLFDIVHDAAKRGPGSDEGVPVYTSDSLDLGTRIDEDSVKYLGGYEFVIQIQNPDNPDDPWDLIDTVLYIELESSSVKKFRIMEDWIFDKKYGDFRPHIIAIAPIVEQFAGGVSLGESPLYWVMMKDLEPILATKPVFNPENSIRSLSYNDWFDFRLFSSYVVGESNLTDLDFKYMDEYQDDGMEQLFQGERVDEELFNMEHDFWEY